MFANICSVWYNVLKERHADIQHVKMLKGCVIMNIISLIAMEVEGACRSRNNRFGYGVWSHHIISVAEYAKIMALELGADVEVVQLAALLHDYAGIKDYSDYGNHHIKGAYEAEKLLLMYGYPKDKVELVKECIMSHRGSLNLEKASIEAVCVSDADALAHIDNVPSLLYLAYNQKGMSIDEGMEWVNSKIQRSYSKLSRYGRQLIADRYEATQRMLSIA